MLCSWNAFVLQNLGDKFLQSDYDSNPATIGYVPPITGDQILTFYGQVEAWISMAQQAHSNPNYRLEVSLPAELPPWSEIEPCPHSHLHAMLEATRSVREHAQAAMLFLPDNDQLTDPIQQAQGHSIRQTLAAAVSKARYAEDLHGDNPSREVHERVEPFLKEAIEGFYRLGQFIAIPQLITIAVDNQSGKVQTHPQFQENRKFALPGQTGFDPWCLTDPVRKSKLMADKKARHAIHELWRLDPAPEKTLAIQAEIAAAFERKDIVYAADQSGNRLGHFFCCPWAPVYSVVRPLTIGGKRLSVFQKFLFDVTAEGVNLGSQFKRHIMVAEFKSTTEFEYGDPNEKPDH
jgi:hypothetical protein